MKKRIIFSLVIVLSLFIITGCSENSSKSNHKSYTCEYTKDKNDEGKRYLTKYIIELNDKNELEVYTLITGFYNYGSKTEGYTEFCKGLEDNKQTDLLEKYKDSVSMKVVCDEKNNYEAYIQKEYQVKKIKDIEDFSSVYKLLETHIKDDGTFDLDSWKNYFDTDSPKSGNYTCDF